MEPWISVAQKQGLRILIESHSTRSETAGFGPDSLLKFIANQMEHSGP